MHRRRILRTIADQNTDFALFAVLDNVYPEPLASDGSRLPTLCAMYAQASCGALEKATVSNFLARSFQTSSLNNCNWRTAIPTELELLEQQTRGYGISAPHE